MEVAALFFYLFAGITVASAFMVIAARNPVHSVLFLILAFVNAAALFLMLGAEFLAMILVVVYVGAVAVLFLFVVMMLDLNTDSMREGFWKHLPVAAVIGALIAFEMGIVLMGGFQLAEAPVATPEQVQMGNSKLLGIEIYTNYLYPLQIAAVLLLVAIVAAIALTLRRRKDSRAMDASEQVKVTKADRLKIVKMAPTAAAPAPAEAPKEGGQA
jgi:NADH-quinone oxidoreductase subunit J